MWSCWPARDWTSQISYEAVASVVRELNVFEALMCFFTICPNINRGAQNVACVGGCVVVPGGVWGGISAGPRGLFSAMLAVATVLMMVC